MTGPELWRELGQQLRVDAVRASAKAGSGHPTSSMSAADLAAVLLDLKQYDAALAALDAKHSDAFAGLFLDMKGDIFNIHGKPADAKTAYEAALAKLDPKGSQKPYTQLKLDAVAATVGAAK